MITIIESPSTDHKEDIRSWLQEEYASTYEGFFVNWHVIEPCFAEGKVHCLAVDDRPIAFGMFTRSYISVMEVHPNYRGQGYGKKLAHHLLQVIESLGASEVYVHCAPETSAPFWESIGFSEIKRDGKEIYKRYCFRDSQSSKHRTSF
ncbi:GNAT family N-acetyltransferase [Undibacterium flavidum]|uniref:GNAT family N-acetyltransferase n=1 Tax=Undibacterium flavidum TaxID=2762297 RepID=A0ABR6Y8C4_9BURK|nr:GNAT family N-acetyltransferase [Undibacterium flavidum]MBC3872409.1 GNAT family N-acetyltransferase [Undibacterium flavidum]